MKTIFVNIKTIEHKWYIIDAEGKILGRLAARVASILRGKHKAVYTPHQEVGDSVIIINAEKVAVSGKKWTDKVYYRHTGYPGGLKKETLNKVMARKPAFPLEHALKGMLPKNRMGRKLFKNAKIYAGPTHPHAAQKPIKIELE
ncbi:MAG TPA: 50S ribosomal protein L13 [Spirochaetia bacterium]|nr:50S ribosomal protein L13 [Spirochaetia bacterium]